MDEHSSRRAFLKAAAAATVAGRVRARAVDAGAPATRPARIMWTHLLHLGCNMWFDWDNPAFRDSYVNMTPNLRFDEKLWNELLPRMADAGINTVILVVADGVRYKSHPEIAVKGAWSTGRLREELARLREHGIEPIPKLNFSTTHDTWMKDYARRVSTEPYYAFCRELIAEVIELFDKPRFFHLGMDEETAAHQVGHEHVVLRQHDLWWRDFLFYVKEVERGGSRAWIWSDYVWEHPEVFFAKMPKGVLQSNWYYGRQFDRKVKAVQAYHQLDEHGYQQVPAASNHSSPQSFDLTVKYCREHLTPERLAGFMQTVWRPLTEQYRDRHLQAVEQVKETVARWNGGE